MSVCAYVSLEGERCCRQSAPGCNGHCVAHAGDFAQKFLGVHITAADMATPAKDLDDEKLLQLFSGEASDVGRKEELRQEALRRMGESALYRALLQEARDDMYDPVFGWVDHKTFDAFTERVRRALAGEEPSPVADALQENQRLHAKLRAAAERLAEVAGMLEEPNG